MRQSWIRLVVVAGFLAFGASLAMADIVTMTYTGVILSGSANSYDAAGVFGLGENSILGGQKITIIERLDTSIGKASNYCTYGPGICNAISEDIAGISPLTGSVTINAITVSPGTPVVNGKQVYAQWNYSGSAFVGEYSAPYPIVSGKPLYSSRSNVLNDEYGNAYLFLEALSYTSSFTFPLDFSAPSTTHYDGLNITGGGTFALMAKGLQGSYVETFAAFTLDGGATAVPELTAWSMLLAGAGALAVRASLQGRNGRQQRAA